MVETTDTILKILRNYINELEKIKIKIEKAYLFGSFAKGKNSKWSDIDVALVSDDFIGVDVLDADKIARATLDTDYRISPLTFKSRDFNEENLFVKQILREGIKII